jgi:hypothetical protein
MTQIAVTRIGEQPGSTRFEVVVSDDGGTSTTHSVSLSDVDRDRLAGSYMSPEDFVRACFAFLLEREPKESILRSFDVSAISTYFPEFDREIAGSV